MYGVQIRLLAALALVIGAAPHASADRLNLAVGGEYSTGDYGDPQDTAVWYEFVSARYVMSPLAFKATVPFLQIDGPATVTDDGEVGGGGADRMVGGIGDVSLSTTYMFAWKPQKIYWDLMGRVRLPTGDENDGLGSGEIDYSLASTLTKEFERLSLYVEAGYRFLGSSVARPREDGMLPAPISTDLARETEIGASFDWRERVRHIARPRRCQHLCSSQADGRFEAKSLRTRRPFERQPERWWRTIVDVDRIPDGLSLALASVLRLRLALQLDTLLSRARRFAVCLTHTGKVLRRGCFLHAIPSCCRRTKYGRTARPGERHKSAWRQIDRAAP
jgi:hypothetical protein